MFWGRGLSNKKGSDAGTSARRWTTEMATCDTAISLANIGLPLKDCSERQLSTCSKRGVASPSTPELTIVSGCAWPAWPRQWASSSSSASASACAPTSCSWEDEWKARLSAVPIDSLIKQQLKNWPKRKKKEMRKAMPESKRRDWRAEIETLISPS